MRARRGGLTWTTLIWVVGILAPSLAGCVDDGSTLEALTIHGRELHEGTVELAAGSLVIPEGAHYEVRDGTLKLYPREDVAVGGSVEVHGTLVLRNATITSLVRLTVHRGASLVLDNVTTDTAAALPAITIGSNDASVRGANLTVSSLTIQGNAVVTDSTIHGATRLPAVVWRQSDVTFERNVVRAQGIGVLLKEVSGSVTGNVVEAAGEAGVVVAPGSRVTISGNTVRAAVGVAVLEAEATVDGNTIRGGDIGVAVRHGRATVTGNDLAELTRAGVALLVARGGTHVAGNTIRDVGDGRARTLADQGAGIAVDGGSPAIEGNRLLDNDVGVAILRGYPTIHGNDLDGNTFFGVARNVSGTQPPTRQVDATGNWWGSAAGPTPSGGGPTGGAADTGGDAVGPGVRYAPWAPEPHAHHLQPND